MGSELMSSRCRHEVVQTAVRTMTKHLHRTSLGARLAELPTGSPPGVAAFSDSTHMAGIQRGRP